MATTLERTLLHAGFSAGVIVTLEHIKQRDQQLTATISEVQAAGNVSTNPWPQIVGRYEGDPSWDGFEDFLKEYRQNIDKLCAESQEE